MIKAIIFDFFGVLCSDEFWQIVKEDKNMPGHFSELAQSVNIGKLSWDNFLAKISDETGQDIEEIRRLYKAESINLPLVSYIETLRAKYKISLLTNASGDFINPLLEKANLTKLFDEVAVSSEIGIAKPDPKIFQYVLDKLKLAPEETVFIDDIQRYCNAADEIGIITVCYRDFEQAKTDLEQILAAASNN